MAAGPDPGWYPDPLGSAQQRWWDGLRWTAALRPVPPDPAAAQVTTVLPPVAGLGPTAEEPAWPAPAPVGAWAPPQEAAGGEDSSGRRRGWVWAGAGATVLAVGLGIGVGIAIRGPGAGGDTVEQPVASDRSVTEEATERPQPMEEPVEITTEPLETEEQTEAEAEAEEPTEDATEGTELEPPPPASEETETEPETEAATEAATGTGTSSGTTRQPPAASTSSSRPSSAELSGATSSYIAALEAGELEWAHDHLTPEMQQRPGWTLAEFIAFWDGHLAGQRS